MACRDLYCLHREWTGQYSTGRAGKERKGAGQDRAWQGGAGRLGELLAMLMKVAHLWVHTCQGYACEGLDALFAGESNTIRYAARLWVSGVLRF